MPSREALVRARKDQLVELGYNAQVIDLALEWAMGCAGGMADYVLREAVEGERPPRDQVVIQFLPQYLTDCEKWIQSFGNRPAKQK